MRRHRGADGWDRVVTGVSFCSDAAFDMRLSEALIAERGLAEVFKNMKIERVELKTETWQWRRTGNIAIEYQCDGQASGIAVTQADCWVHELRSDAGETICYLMFPVEQLKELARRAIRAGRCSRFAGDGRRSVALIALRDILQLAGE